MEKDEYTYSERNRIGNMLQSARKSQGITIIQLSEKTGFNPSNISRIEQGKYNLSIDILTALCKALGLKVELTNYIKMKEYTAIYSTEAIKDIHYSFVAESNESAIEFCKSKFNVAIDKIICNGEVGEVGSSDEGEIVYDR